MNEPQAKPVTVLLARKGLATPVGAASAAAPAPTSDGTLDPETLPEVGALAAAGAAPAASLLPLDFLAGRPPGQPGAGDRAQIAANVSEAAAVPAEAPEAVPQLTAKHEVPRPDPALRLGGRIGAGANPVARAEPRRFPVLAAGLALALLLGTAGYGYRSGWFAIQSPERPQAPAVAALVPAESPPAAPSRTETDPGAKSDRSSGAVQPSVDVVRIEPGGAAVIAGRAAPGVVLILLDNGAPIGTVTADANGEWVFIPASPLPSGAHDFGLVIEEVRGGVSVPAAGQAPAKQETTGPGLAGTNKPGTVAGVAATVPIPPRKPDTGIKRAAGAPSAAFVVQLASVKSRTGAQREWQALRRRFPEILSQMSLSLDEAKLAGGASVVRLRIGAFPKQGEAAALCALLAAKHQDCLVVRTTARR